MARVLYSGIVTELKGSIAGTTFQQNASGKIAKARSNQRFSSSPLQSGTQGHFSTCVARWRSLSLADRSAWDLMASTYPRTDKWGVLKTLSGFQYHAAANRNLLTIGQALQDSPSPYVVPLSVNAYSLFSDTTHFTLTFGAALDLTDYVLLIFASPPTQKLSSTSRVQRRLILQATGGPFTVLELLSNYLAVYPLDWVDLNTYAHCIIKLFLCTVAISTGLTSQFLTNQLSIG